MLQLKSIIGTSGPTPSRPAINAGVAQEQKSLLAKLFNDIEPVRAVSTALQICQV